MSAGQPIDELLTGFLDGKLDGEERRQLNSMLAAEPALNDQLSRLIQIREDLQAVPKQRLRADFSTRVIQAARRQATADGLPADHHVLKELTPAPRVRGAFLESHRKLIGAVAALAASIVLAIFFVQGSGVIGPNKDQVVLSSEGDSSHQGVSLESGSDSPFSSAIAVNPPTSGSEAIEMELGSKPVSPVRVSPRNRKPIQLLLIFDLKITKSAWDSNVLGTILENSGIHWSDPIFANTQVAGSLAKTRSIVQNSSKQETQEEVALILVSASARALDKAMLDVWQRTRDFPVAALDIAFDLPGEDLLRNLNAAIDNEDSGQNARPLILTSIAGTGLDDIAQFSTQEKFVSSDERRGMFSSTAFTADDDVPSYALLVVRKPSKP